jgi:class 3 adenylate cyclase
MMNHSSLIHVVVAVFDLEGSSAMTARPDSLAEGTKYAEHFFQWMSTSVVDRLGLTRPSYRSLLGDGALFIWESNEAEESELVGRLLTVAMGMTDEFRESIADQLEGLVNLSPLPRILRVGIASGSAVKVPLATGDGSAPAYSAFCISLATRLQKVCSGLSFAASARLGVANTVADTLDLVVQVANLRGIGEEKILVRRGELRSLAPDQRRILVDPGKHPPRDFSEGRLTHDDAMELADAISRRATRHPTFVESAKQMLRRLAEKYPDVAAILIEQAKISRIGNTGFGLEEAHRLTSKAIQLDPKYPRALFNRACYATLLAVASKDDPVHQRRMTEDALADLRMALTLDRAWCAWVTVDSDLEYLRSLPEFSSLAVEFGFGLSQLLSEPETSG